MEWPSTLHCLEIQLCVSIVPWSPEVPSVASECGESDTGKDTCSFETQTELTMKDVSSCLSENAALKERFAYLEQELAAAKEKVLGTVEKLETLTISKLTRDKVMESDNSVKFYMGLVSVHMFNCLWCYLSWSQLQKHSLMLRSSSSWYSRGFV